MYDGSFVQDRDILRVPSKRRNPIIADAFNRLRLMERRGSGFKKICSDYAAQVNYTEDMVPQFYSDYDSFVLTLSNLNYNVREQETKKKDTRNKIIVFCIVPRSRVEILQYLGLGSKSALWRNYLKPLILEGKLQMTIPEQPKNRNQKYVTVQ